MASRQMHELGGRLTIIAAVLLAYVVAGKAGLSVAVVNASATAVWAPTGISIAALLLFGTRVWPGILLGAFIVNQTTAGSVVTSLAIAAGNTGEALVAAYLTKRFARGRDAFQRSQDVFRFVFLAGFLATTISATAGVTSLALAGQLDWSQYRSIWLTWWLGNAAGAVLVTPLLVLWITNPRLRQGARGWLELALLACSVGLVAWIVFVESSLPLEFLFIPLCVWAGVRFGPRKATTVTCLLAGFAVWATVNGSGPFASHPPNTALLLTQMFMVVAQVAGVAIGAAVAERRRAEESLSQLNEELEQRVRRRTADLVASEARLQEAQEVAHVGSWDWNISENELWWSDELYRMFRVDRGSFRPSYEAFLAAIHPEDRGTERGPDGPQNRAVPPKWNSGCSGAMRKSGSSSAKAAWFATKRGKPFAWWERLRTSPNSGSSNWSFDRRRSSKRWSCWPAGSLTTSTI